MASTEGPSELFLLFLQLHPVRKIPSDAWDFLSAAELVKLSILSKTIRAQLKQIEYTHCCNSRLDYRVPFPGFPGLNLTPINSTTGDGGLFQHQLASLRAMYYAENSNQVFGGLRGGILGDAPGLGKTITILALICSTAGTRPIAPADFWDSERVQEHWQAFRLNPESQSAMLKALKPLRQFAQGRRGWGVYKEMERYVTPPYKKNDARFPTIDSVIRYVVRTLKDFVPLSELELFRQNLIKIKSELDPRNRRLLRSQRGRRLTLERSLIVSSATLIIVPDALLEHWFQQIHQNVILDVFCDANEQSKKSGTKHGVVFLDGVGDLADVADSTTALRNVNLGQDIVPCWMLSKYFIVVTTFSRCEQEFRRLTQKRRLSEVEIGRDSPLLQLRWLRLVVDEGHELGMHGAGNRVTRFINEVAAERRWCMSGTPTTGDEDSKGFSQRALDQLQRLLFFLRHPTYGTLPSALNDSSSPYVHNDKERTTEEERRKKRTSIAKQRWESEIKQPFLMRKIQGRQQLVKSLKEIMVIHRKEDICLPKPIFLQSEVNVHIPIGIQDKIMEDPSDVNLVSKLDTYLHSVEFQTLVDQSQANHILEKIRYARNADSLLRPIKAVVYSSVNNNLLSVTDCILRNLDFENVAELYDTAGIGDTSSELTRFRNGFKECKTCPICERSIDISARNPGNRCESYLLEVVTIDEEKRFLVEPERIVRTLNVPSNRLGSEALSSYSKLSKFWRVGDILKIDTRDNHPLHPRRRSEKEWKRRGSRDCIARAAADSHMGPDWYFGPFGTDPDDYLVDCKLVKWQFCSRFHNRWYLGPRPSDVPIQRKKEDCYVLALHAGLSHGLDLSFVTHLFLLEPVDDAAVLEQVTSRAHRLGATGPVVVDTVNPFYKIAQDMQKRINQAEGDVDFSQDKEKTLKKVHCGFCFRQFPSIAQAEEHERTNCPRNPQCEQVVESFRLSSVYREIRPPPAVDAVSSVTESE